MNTLRTIEGSCLAGIKIINIKIDGKPGHPCYPGETIDPIKPAAKIYCEIDDYHE